MITFTSDSGELVGSVMIPANIANSGGVFVEAVFVNHIQQNSDDIGSTVLDLTITDALGKPITELNEPIEICLEQDTDEGVSFLGSFLSSFTDRIFKGDGCLSFFNVETEEWECEDECLKKEGNTLCGTTGLYSVLYFLVGNNNIILTYFML